MVIGSCASFATSGRMFHNGLRLPDELFWNTFSFGFFELAKELFLLPKGHFSQHLSACGSRTAAFKLLRVLQREQLLGVQVWGGGDTIFPVNRVLAQSLFKRFLKLFEKKPSWFFIAAMWATVMMRLLNWHHWRSFGFGEIPASKVLSRLATKLRAQREFWRWAIAVFKLAL